MYTDIKDVKAVIKTDWEKTGRTKFAPGDKVRVMRNLAKSWTADTSDVIKNLCDKKKVNLKFQNDVFVNRKKICGVLQEKIISGYRKFLIIGIGVNIVSNPDISNEYQATNIFLETKK